MTNNTNINLWDSYTQDITLENCNARLSVLYKERDKISRQISLVAASGRDTLYYENKHYKNFKFKFKQSYN